MTNENLLDEISVIEMTTRFSNKPEKNSEILNNITDEYGLLTFGNIERLLIKAFSRDKNTTALKEILDTNKGYIGVAKLLAVLIDDNGKFNSAAKVNENITSDTNFMRTEKKKQVFGKIAIAYETAAASLENKDFYNWLESSLMPNTTKLRMLQEKYAVKQR